jgi:two-component system chemotaxis sensor kinase CheA
MTELRRDVHTLKGVAALFGVETVAARCHELESQIDETGKGLSNEDCRSVAALWSDYRARIEPLLGDHRDRIEISTGDLDRAIVEAEGSSPTLATRMREWRKEPVARRFERAAQQLKQLAVRLGKPEPIVKIEANGLRLERDAFASFWASLAHVLRNAVDHGLEPEQARVEANKPARGTVTLSATVQNGELEIEVGDDGAGIDWDRLVGRARARTTLSEDGERARLEALFAEGVSSRDEVTAFSGRGVGMGAIKSVTEALGARLEVESARGKGTVVRCIFTRVSHSRAA